MEASFQSTASSETEEIPTAAVSEDGYCFQSTASSETPALSEALHQWRDWVSKAQLVLKLYSLSGLTEEGIDDLLISKAQLVLKLYSLSGLTEEGIDDLLISKAQLVLKRV